jgi:hypothetical protein
VLLRLKALKSKALKVKGFEVKGWKSKANRDVGIGRPGKFPLALLRKASGNFLSRPTLPIFQPYLSVGCYGGLA